MEIRQIDGLQLDAIPPEPEGPDSLGFYDRFGSYHKKFMDVLLP